jgi:hypothetical protein
MNSIDLYGCWHYCQVISDHTRVFIQLKADYRPFLKFSIMDWVWLCGRKTIINLTLWRTHSLKWIDNSLKHEWTHTFVTIPNLLWDVWTNQNRFPWKSSFFRYIWNHFRATLDSRFAFDQYRIISKRSNLLETYNDNISNLVLLYYY